MNKEKKQEKREKQNPETAIDCISPQNYESAIDELELLVARMEEGSLSLEAALAAYRRGTVLVSYAQKQLEIVEKQVCVFDGEAIKPLSEDEVG